MVGNPSMFLPLANGCSLASLTQMYTGLCECCYKPQKECIQANTSQMHRSIKKEQPNRFRLLSDSPFPTGHSDTLEPSVSQWPSHSTSVASANMDHRIIPRLIDDKLGEACELCRNFEVKFSNENALDQC